MNFNLHCKLAKIGAHEWAQNCKYKKILNLNIFNYISEMNYSSYP